MAFVPVSQRLRRAHVYCSESIVVSFTVSNAVASETNMAVDFVLNFSHIRFPGRFYSSFAFEIMFVSFLYYLILSAVDINSNLFS